MSGFSDPLVGGLEKLIRKAIQSPNFIAGVSGWSINKDGTAEFNELVITIQSTGVALLIYNGAAGFGNLIGSWAADAGTDAYGNPYPAGLGASQGDLTGVSLEASTLTQCVLNECSTTNTTMNGPNITGGTITETTITFDSQGGALFAYTTTTTVVTQTGGGDYTFTVPANVNTIKVENWAAGAGGDGGNSTTGGNGGGAGEYAAEPNYPVTPAAVLNYSIGDGGGSSITGSGHGGDGGDTVFDNGGVYAHGGLGNGTGGTGSINTTHHNGGAGGVSHSGDTGAAGGGGSAGATGAGGAGTSATGSTGQNGGSAGAGGGAAGGKGGNNAANGTAGSAPGGAGGGAGAGSATNTFDKTYTATHSYSYEGSDGGNANQQINVDGRMYQGGDSANTFNGKSKTWILFNHSQIASDLSGVSLTAEKVTLNNSHSWNNSGMTVALGYDTTTSFGGTKGDPSGSDTDRVEFSVAEGATITKDITNHGFGSAFQSGGATTLVLFKNSNSLTYYGYFAGAGQSGPPTLRFIGTTGTGSTTSGAGADGQVKITYTSASTLVIAIGPTAGTDPLGNTYKAGISSQDMYVGPGLDKPLRYVAAEYPSGRFSNSRSNTITKTADDYLVVAVEANATYEIECLLTYTGGATGATNLRWNWTGPTGAEWEVGHWYFNTSNAFTYEYHDDSSGDAIAYTTGTANGNQRPVVIKGTLYTGANAGNFSLVWAQGTSSGTTTRLWSGSRLTLRKVA